MVTQTEEALLSGVSKLRLGASHSPRLTLALPRLQDFDGCHPSGGGGFDAHGRVLKYKTFFWVDAKAFGGEEKGFRIRLAALVVSRADQRVEFVEQTKRLERCGDGLACASGDDSEGKRSMTGLDDVEDFRHSDQARQVLVVEVLLADGDFFDGHAEAVALIERGDDFMHGHSAPLVEEVFGEVAAVLAERLLPGDVVQGHGVGNGSVAVEEISLEWALGDFELHGVTWRARTP